MNFEVVRCINFLKLLADQSNSKRQKRALLDSVTPTQLLCLEELFANLLYNQDLPLSEKDKAFVKSKSRLLRPVLEKKSSAVKKKNYIYKYSLALLKFISHFETDLNALLREF